MEKVDEERAGSQGGQSKLDDVTFRCLLDLLMCSDPWPITDKLTELPLICLATDESRSRGFSEWISAYHDFTPAEKLPDWIARRGLAQGPVAV